MRGLILTLSPAVVSALYGSTSPVKMLGASDLLKIKESDEPWMVEFYASWCGHCKQLAPEYEKAAKALKGIVNLGAVEDQNVMQEFGVQGFPTIKFFGDSSKPDDYQGPRTADGIVEDILKRVKGLATKRLGGGGRSSSGGSSSGGSGGSDVIVLGDDNFDSEVLGDDEGMWFVEFYAPWCGHCKSLEPVWEELATDCVYVYEDQDCVCRCAFTGCIGIRKPSMRWTMHRTKQGFVGKKAFAFELKGKVKVAKVDATAHEAVAQRFGIRGFPTIKFFDVGPKTDSNAQAYEGGRDLDSLKQFAVNKHMTTRNEVLDMYNDALRTSGVAAEFFWSQGGDQFDLEESLHLSFGYPALVAISKKKQVFGVHRGQFSKEGIRGFLVGLGGRNARLEALPESLRIVGADEWDGKDGELPVEEPLDYEEEL
eukprot:gene200-98_t